MLRITCPYCGVRDEQEFEFGGPSHVVRPVGEVSDAQWSEYLFNNDNPKGLHFERWGHLFGCCRWFNVVRHTVTHEVLVTYEMGERQPGKVLREEPKRKSSIRQSAMQSDEAGS